MSARDGTESALEGQPEADAAGVLSLVRTLGDQKRHYFPTPHRLASFTTPPVGPIPRENERTLFHPGQHRTRGIMKQDEPTLDHDVLAAYISNTLSPDVRASITRQLVCNPEARQLLAMAAKAVGEERNGYRDQLLVEARDRNAERAGAHRATGLDRSR